jgi:translation initiation factor 1A
MEDPRICTKQFAPIVGKNVRFHSNLTQTDLFTVENAGQDEDLR